MKKDTHPDYKTVKFTCTCGATFTAGSTMQDDFKTEICSKCHPFYTGKQKLVDSSGRVDKFVAKMKKARDAASETGEVSKKPKVAKETDLKDIKKTQSEPEPTEKPEKAPKDAPKAKKEEKNEETEATLP